MAGSELSTADAALFPTFVFYELMLPSIFGWQDVFAGRPKLRAWWENMKQDPIAAKVRGAPVRDVPLGRQACAYGACGMTGCCSCHGVAVWMPWTREGRPLGALVRAWGTCQGCTWHGQMVHARVACMPARLCIYPPHLTLTPHTAPRVSCMPTQSHPQVMEEVRGGLQGWVDKDRWTELGIRQQVADSKYKWAY